MRIEDLSRAGSSLQPTPLKGTAAVQIPGQSPGISEAAVTSQRTAILVLSRQASRSHAGSARHGPRPRPSSARRALSEPAAGPPRGRGGAEPGRRARHVRDRRTGRLRLHRPAPEGLPHALGPVRRDRRRDGAGDIVRLAGPLAGDKRRDPAVVVVDDAGRFAVSVLGGHGTGADELAQGGRGPRRDAGGHDASEAQSTRRRPDRPGSGLEIERAET